MILMLCISHLNSNCKHYFKIFEFEFEFFFLISDNLPFLIFVVVETFDLTKNITFQRL